MPKILYSRSQNKLHLAKNPELENWPDSGTIFFQQVSVKYRPNLDRVLKNLTVSIRSNEK